MIGECRAQRDRAGRFVHRHVRELNLAGIAVIAAILELEAHARAAGRHLAALKRTAQRGQIGARLLHVHIDRVEALDDRQRIGLVGVDQRADSKQ